MELHTAIDLYEKKASGCRRREAEYIAKHQNAMAKSEMREAELYEATIEWLSIIKEDYRV